MVFDIVPVTSPRQTDCGASCLKMLLSYYGTDLPLEQLIKECNTRLIGCTGKDLLRVGRAHGLTDMLAYNAPPADFYKQDRPAIILWMYNHFVIFGGVDNDGKVVIYNPDRGRYRVSKSVFGSLYSGTAFANGMPQDLEVS